MVQNPFPLVQKTTAIEKAVGAFLIASALVFIGNFAWKARSEHWFEVPVRYTMVIPEGYGIRTGTPVKLNGIQVGMVDAMELTSGGQVRVDLNVRKRYASLVTEDSEVTVEVPPILGETVIGIQTPAVVVATQPIPPRSEIKNVRLPSKLFEKIGVTADDVTDLVHNLNETLVLVRRTIENVEGITKGILQGEGSLGAFFRDRALYDNLNAAIAHAEQVVEKVNRGVGTAGRVINDPALYDEAARAMRELRMGVEDLREIQARLRVTVDTLNEGLADVADTVADTKEIVAGINRGEGTVGKLLKDDTVYMDTHRILAELRETIEDAREQAPISAFIGSVFGAF